MNKRRKNIVWFKFTARSFSLSISSLCSLPLTSLSPVGKDREGEGQSMERETLLDHTWWRVFIDVQNCSKRLGICIFFSFRPQKHSLTVKSGFRHDLHFNKQRWEFLSFPTLRNPLYIAVGQSSWSHRKCYVTSREWPNYLKFSINKLQAVLSIIAFCCNLNGVNYTMKRGCIFKFNQVK